MPVAWLSANDIPGVVRSPGVCLRREIKEYCGTIGAVCMKNKCAVLVILRGVQSALGTACIIKIFVYFNGTQKFELYTDR